MSLFDCSAGWSPSILAYFAGHLVKEGLRLRGEAKLVFGEEIIIGFDCVSFLAKGDDDWGVDLVWSKGTEGLVKLEDVG